MKNVIFTLFWLCLAVCFGTYGLTTGHPVIIGVGVPILTIGVLIIHWHKVLKDRAAVEWGYEKFLTLVYEEIVTLRTTLKPKQKARLDINTFDHNDIALCIYGQISGESPRGINIYPKSYNFAPKTGSDFATWRAKEQTIKHPGLFTALEVYLYFPAAKPKDIIAFIKGEIPKLELW